MKIRDKLNQQFLKSVITLFLGSSLIILGYIFESSVLVALSVLIAILLIVVASINLSFRLQCPSCGCRIYLSKFNFPPSFFSMPESIKYCHHCGVDFDSEIEDMKGEDAGRGSGKTENDPLIRH